MFGIDLLGGENGRADGGSPDADPGGQAGETADPDPETHSITGERYQMEPTGEIEREGGRVTKVEVDVTDEPGEDETDVVAGPHVRRLIEGTHDEPRQDYLLGYQEDMQEGFVAAGIPYGQQFRHSWISGINGSGKSKQMEGLMLQRAYAGDGFAYFDPKGNDSKDLLRKLPAHRLSDVVWVEPGDTEYERTVGLNPLAVPVDEDATDAEIADAVETRLGMLKAALAAKGELHATMESVTESMGRAMMYANADPERSNYSIIDMYFILLGADRREAFAEECADPYISEFLEEIADMEDDALRPLLKRLKAWVENGVVRRIIARRDPTIDFDDVVRNNRILIVRTPLGASDDVKKLTTLSVWREVYAAKLRANEESGVEGGSYFIYADEFDSIVSEELDLKGMLARARSERVGVTVAVQYPSQLSESARRPLQSNADNSLFMRTPNRDDARILMGRFRGHDADDLTDTNDYHLWTELATNDGGRSPPLKLKTWPPMPNLRGEDDVEEVIRDALDRFGDDPLTDEDIQRELQFGDISEATGDFEATEDARRAAAKAVHDAALRTDAEDEWVHLDGVADDVRRYVARETGITDEQAEELLGSNGKLYRQVLKLCRKELDDRDADDGGTELRATDKTIAEIKAVGESEPDGGPEHGRLLRTTYNALASRGGEVEILRQGDGSMPDARVTAGPHADDVVVELCGGRGESVPVEAEKSTGKDKPGQTVLNLAGATNDGRTCVFVARPQEARRVWSTLAGEPRMASECDAASGLTRLYNSTSRVRVGGDLAYRHGSRESHWFRDESSGEYVLRDDDGEEHARFASAAGVGRNADAYAAVGDPGGDDLRTIRAPVIPSRAFDEEPPAPDGDAWHLLVVDDGDLEIYQRGGDTEPLGALVQDDGHDLPDDLGDNPRALAARLADEWDDVDGAGVTITEAHEMVDADPDLPDRSRRTVGNWIDALADAGVVEQVEDGSKPGNVYRLARND